jgi:hypothetical protein
MWRLPPGWDWLIEGYEMTAGVRVSELRRKGRPKEGAHARL